MHSLSYNDKQLKKGFIFTIYPLLRLPEIKSDIDPVIEMFIVIVQPWKTLP